MFGMERMETIEMVTWSFPYARDPNLKVGENETVGFHTVSYGKWFCGRVVVALVESCRQSSNRCTR